MDDSVRDVSIVDEMLEDMSNSPKVDVSLEEWQGVPVLNTVVLTGRLGKDPVLKTIRDDLVVCTFSLAFTHDWDPMEQDQDNTSWIEVECWGSTAKSVERRLRKGLRVGVTGRLCVNKWTGRDGVDRETVILKLLTFEILQSRNESEPRTSGQSDWSSKASSSAPTGLDGLPF